jgi:sterol 3beta-glucosyltransferase
VKERVEEIAKGIMSEDGATGAVKAFLKHLPPKLPQSAPQDSSSHVPPLLRPLRKCLGLS